MQLINASADSSWYATLWQLTPMLIFHPLLYKQKREINIGRMSNFKYMIFMVLNAGVSMHELVKPIIRCSVGRLISIIMLTCNLYSSVDGNWVAAAMSVLHNEYTSRQSCIFSWSQSDWVQFWQVQENCDCTMSRQ